MHKLVKVFEIMNQMEKLNQNVFYLTKMYALFLCGLGAP
jgi:hypothetical protein